MPVASDTISCISPDDSLSAVLDGTLVNLVENASKRVLWSFEVGLNVTGLAFAPDRYWLIVTTSDGKSRNFDLENKEWI
jgi:hypothetical protein